MAAPRPRMQYGDRPAGGYAYDEAPARQELFAGAAGPYNGAPAGGSGSAPRPGPSGRAPLSRQDVEHMDNRQILQHGVEMHKETTATARRALQVRDPPPPRGRDGNHARGASIGPPLGSTGRHPMLGVPAEARDGDRPSLTPQHPNAP
jgi:hypothetical protein